MISAFYLFRENTIKNLRKKNNLLIKDFNWAAYLDHWRAIEDNCRTADLNINSFAGIHLRKSRVLGDNVRLNINSSVSARISVTGLL